MPPQQRPVLVVGGTGFLGRAIAATLAGRGHAVRVAARAPDATPLPGGVERRCADIRRDDEIAAALEGAEAVINAVSLYTEGGGLDFRRIHVEGARRLARLACAAGVRRLVHVSGIGADPDSASAYVRARALGEAAVQAECPDAAILRPSVLFGPGDPFLATLERVTRAPVIPLFGVGRTRLQPVHVDDVARAAAVLATDGPSIGGTWELGGADVLTYREVVTAILRHYGRKRVLIPVPFAAWHTMAWAASALASPPITHDQLALMQSDNVVPPEAATFADLGLRPAGFLARLAHDLPGAR